jgi:hypothetical protein
LGGQLSTFRRNVSILIGDPQQSVKQASFLKEVDKDWKTVVIQGIKDSEPEVERSQMRVRRNIILQKDPAESICDEVTESSGNIERVSGEKSLS